MDAVHAAGGIALNHRSEGYLAKAVSALGSGRKFSSVLEMAAHANLIGDLGVLATGGKLGVIGSKAKPIEFNPRLLMAPEISVMGIFLGTSTPEDKEEIHAGLYKAMEAGTHTPVVGMRLPLEEAARAHKEVMEPSTGGAIGNIVLEVC